jgi:Uma2 family endonuclease
MDFAYDHPWFSVEEYFEIEESSNIRHEYFRGNIYAMVGASFNHNRITRNFSIVFQRFLKCETFTSDLKVEAADDTYFYPDVVMVCGKIIEGSKPNTLKNPSCIIEVLSPSTALYDKNKKAKAYKNISTLEYYLLANQDKVEIEQHIRKDVGWLVKTYTNINSFITIYNKKFKLSSIYKNAALQA